MMLSCAQFFFEGFHFMTAHMSFSCQDLDLDYEIYGMSSFGRWTDVRKLINAKNLQMDIFKGRQFSDLQYTF